MFCLGRPRRTICNLSRSPLPDCRQLKAELWKGSISVHRAPGNNGEVGARPGEVLTSLLHQTPVCSPGFIPTDTRGRRTSAPPSLTGFPSEARCRCVGASPRCMWRGWASTAQHHARAQGLSAVCMINNSVFFFLMKLGNQSSIFFSQH